MVYICKHRLKAGVVTKECLRLMVVYKRAMEESWGGGFVALADRGCHWGFLTGQSISGEGKGYGQSMPQVIRCHGTWLL